MISPVFIDASFWISYRDEREARQPAAHRAVIELFRQRARFVTTLPVFCEIHATFSRHPRKRAVILDDFWNNPLVTIEDVSPQDQEAAIDLLRGNSDKTYPLCDALSFVVMRRLQIQRVAAFDSHFRQLGEFEVIP